jgi:hypothetical protein
LNELSTVWALEYPHGYREYLTPCGNSLCTGGGFATHEVVREMIEMRETSRVVSAMLCRGNERMGRGSYRRCLHEAGPVSFAIEYQ